MNSKFKKNDLITITRKPKDSEPLNDFWIDEMDAYLGTSGKVIDISFDNDPSNPTPQDIECVEVEHPNGNVYTYPYYCLTRKITLPPIACSCKTEILINRGCQCGAFKKEQNSKKK